MSSQARILDSDEIKEFIKDDDAKLVARQKWPLDKEKRLILAAMKAKKLSVILKGKRFDFRYTTSGEAFLSPRNSTGEFIPCGWFSEAGLEKDLLGTKESNGKQKT